MARWCGRGAGFGGGGRQGLTGTRALEAGDLEPVLARFREMLVEKNVAVEIAEKLCGRRASPPSAGLGGGWGMGWGL